METAWFLIIASLCAAALLRSIFTTTNKRLPPGPLRLPLIGNLLWLRSSISDLEYIVRRLTPRYGPLITLRILNRSFIFVNSHSLAHQALVQNGAVFADRPDPAANSRMLKKPQITINTSSYGPTWRLLRRNLTHEILHPSRVRGYAASRRWVLSLLIRRIRDTSGSESSVRVVDHFQYAMFCLLVLMCFGDKLDENQIKQIETAHRDILQNLPRFNVLNLWPRLGKIIFRNRWKEMIQLRENQERVLIPLIRARIQAKQDKTINQEDDVVAYVDTLADLHLPDENRKLHEIEIQSLCREFLNAGTDTTSTSLQWIMANLVNYPQIQNKLYQEIISVAGPPPHAGEESRKEVAEEDLQKLPYLKAVVLEALRRHPPGHFVVPHKVSQDTELDGYTIPKDAVVNFMVADMGWDPEVWEDPMEFKPERFLSSSGKAFDITGNREIKMMPFGAGRRVCPGLALALLHLEYFVANLIWLFEWSHVEGDEVDFSEKQEFTVVMKNPLRACITPRSYS